MDHRLAAIVLDSLDFGAVILDAGRHICLTNERARELAERRDALCFAGSQLRMLLARDHAVFESYIARSHVALAPLGMILRRSSGKPDYLFTVRRLDAALFYASVHEPAAPRSIDARMLRQMYGMTPAEIAIVSGLFEGSSVNDLTQRLGVSSNTVRTHLKSVYAKCEVSSQGQLLKLLALSFHQMR